MTRRIDRWELWAPRARAVELVIGDRERRLASSIGDGRWIAPPPPRDADYGISVDGGPVRPDPRSRFQPHGVHGRSRWVDDDFPWTDRGFQPPPLASGLIYELHVGTFTPHGTFDAAIDRLDHLVALGVTHVELMPVAAFPGSRGWGYDGVALYAVHAGYGGPAGLRRFVDACHRHGLAVLLDVVYNHLGPEGNYLAELGPYFTDRHRTPWGAAINLDGPGSDQVRRFLVDNAVMWLRDYHLDGLRLDATQELHDESAYHFLDELVEEVRSLQSALGRTLVLIAESDRNDPRLLHRRDAGGHGLDAVCSDDFHDAVHALLTGERDRNYADFGTLGELSAALSDGFCYQGRYSVYRGRRHGRPLGALGGGRLVASIQNHDQIGNRARGERLGHLVSPARLRIAAALLMMSPFVPMLFQGEEWGATSPFLYFTDVQPPALAASVRDGRRAEHAGRGGDPAQAPDPQDPSTFRRSILDWTELVGEPHRSVASWYAALIALRRGQPDLRDGRRDRVVIHRDPEGAWLVVRRGAVTLACNLGPEPVRLPTPEGDLFLCNGDEPHRDGDRIALSADGCAIWVVD